MKKPAAQENKVCVLINSLAGGGAEKVVATLYPEYQKAGVRVSLLCLEKNDFHVIEGVTPNYLSQQSGELERGFKKLISLFGFAMKFRNYVQQNQIGLVQSHIYRSNYVNILARLLGGEHKTQLVNHGMPSQYRSEGLLGRVNLFLVRWLYPKADQVICPSKGMIKEFIDLGVPEERLQLIRNPFDLDHMAEAAKQDMVEGELEFDLTKKYIIFIGRLQAVKRIEDIVWAYYDLQKEMDDVELIMLGEGEKSEAVSALVMRLAIGKKVHLPGQVENPYKYLARSSMLVSASEFEGFSNVIVESLAVGVPVISTDCESGPREILSPGQKREKPISPGGVERVANGLMVPVGDIKAMTKAMKKLLGDTGLQAALRKSGMDRVRRFSKHDITKDYLWQIEQCTENKEVS